MLTSLPDELGGCGALQELYVDRNPTLSTLPSSLSACTRLRHLFCDPGLVAGLSPELAALAKSGGGRAAPAAAPDK